MEWVVDCSFTSALLLPDEVSMVARRFFDALRHNDTAWIPGIWWLETANVLCMAERRHRLTHQDILHAMTLLEDLSLKTDQAHGTGYLRTVTALAGSGGLSAYDAAYVELAIRKNARLASCDKQLVAAAKNARVDVLDI
jgi:predicted nucleic acid-binding protein